MKKKKSPRKTSEKKKKSDFNSQSVRFAVCLCVLVLLSKQRNQSSNVGFSSVLRQWWTVTQSSCEGWGAAQERGSVTSYRTGWAWTGVQSLTEDPVKRFLLEVYEQKSNLTGSSQVKQAICQRTYAEFSGIQKLWRKELSCSVESLLLWLYL